LAVIPLYLFIDNITTILDDSRRTTSYTNIDTNIFTA